MAVIRLGVQARKLIAENVGNNTIIKKIDPDWPSFRDWLCEQCGGQARYILSYKVIQDKEDFERRHAVGLQKFQEVKKKYMSFCSDFCVKRFWEPEDSIDYIRSEIRSEMGKQTVGFTDSWGAQLGWLNCQHYGPHD